MPITANAKKALRQQKTRSVRNNIVKSMVRTSIKKVTVSPSTETTSGAFSLIDKAVKRNIIHKNKAARLKSHLAKMGTTGKVVIAKKTVAKKSRKKATSKKK